MEKKQFEYINYLRVLAMLFIIAAHTICTPVIYYSTFYSSFGLNISVILTNIFRTGVTIFIMISGALFLRPEKENSIKKLLGKNILRIFLCLLIFGSLFALMEIVFVNKTFKVSFIFESLLRMLQNKSWGHLWYLYMLIGLYLITPILKVFINNCSDTKLYYFLIILFIFNFIIPLINGITGMQVAFTISFAGTNLFFYLLGYVFHSRKIVIPKSVALCGLIIGICYLFLMYLLNSPIDVQKVTYSNNFNIDILVDLIPVSIFVLFCNEEDMKKTKIVSYMSEQSFGVYIFHAVFLNFIYKVLKLPSQFYKGIKLLLLWVIVFIITLLLSLIVTTVLRKIKFIRKWIL